MLLLCYAINYSQGHCVVAGIRVCFPTLGDLKTPKNIQSTYKKLFAKRVVIFNVCLQNYQHILHIIDNATNKYIDEFLY